MVAPVLFSSAIEEWETPPEFFAKLHRRFDFTLDVCARPENAKLPDFISPEQDALSKLWLGRCWMNPPYGRQIGLWIQRAYEQVELGVAELVVGLIPARTDTRWWHEYVMQATRVWFVRGRLRFVGAKHYAPFPSAVVLWKAYRLGRAGFSSMER